jgi:hypothetical protein
MKAYKYYMTITDVEFNDTYDYEALFLDHFEADKFLTENEEVGNTIVIHKYEEVETDLDELNSIHRK